MIYQAKWKGKVIAEADEQDVILIEGNKYFPPAALEQAIEDGTLKHSDYHTTCVWKGLASYYDVVVGDEVNTNAAWYYPEPKAGSREIVGKDFANYIAFWRGVEVKPKAESKPESGAKTPALPLAA